MDILNDRTIADRYFFPRAAPFEPVTRVEVNGASLGCWRSGPRSSGWTVIFFHGNGETVADWLGSPLDAFTEAAETELFLAEYRGYGVSTGAPRILDMLGDLDAIRAEIGVPDERVVVFGRSVGSLFALDWIRRFPSTGGLILESGIHDVHERLRLRVHPRELGLSEEGFQSACQERFPTHETLASWSGATLILHAADDELVDVSHAERNAGAAVNPTLRVYPKGGHNAILARNHAAYARDVVGFLQMLIAGPSPTTN